MYSSQQEQCKQYHTGRNKVHEKHHVPTMVIQCEKHHVLAMVIQCEKHHVPTMVIQCEKSEDNMVVNADVHVVWKCLTQETGICDMNAVGLISSRVPTSRKVKVCKKIEGDPLSLNIFIFLYWRSCKQLSNNASTFSQSHEILLWNGMRKHDISYMYSIAYMIHQFQ